MRSGLVTVSPNTGDSTCMGFVTYSLSARVIGCSRSRPSPLNTSIGCPSNLKLTLLMDGNCVSVYTTCPRRANMDMEPPPDSYSFERSTVATEPWTSMPRTLYLGIDVQGSVATVDLSKEYESGGGSMSMFARLGQVVYTLTQFPSISSVSFKLDGQPIEVFSGEGLLLEHPMTRADNEYVTNPIHVESPVFGDTVTSPLRIYGTSNVFEATSQVRILDSAGGTLNEVYVTATSGTGTRGTYDVTVPFTAAPGSDITLMSFEYSAKDGSMINISEIPLHVAP